MSQKVDREIYLSYVQYFSTTQSLSKIDEIKRVQHSVKCNSGVCGYEVHDITIIPLHRAVLKTHTE